MDENIKEENFSNEITLSYTYLTEQDYIDIIKDLNKNRAGDFRSTYERTDCLGLYWIQISEDAKNPNWVRKFKQIPEQLSIEELFELLKTKILITYQ